MGIKFKVFTVDYFYIMEIYSGYGIYRGGTNNDIGTKIKTTETMENELGAF